ncbi:MAG: gliding motility lipoprotein GldD, partial [Paludibacteraceae bacterium]
MKISKLNFILISILTGLVYSCGKAAIPRPYGYFRVDLPPHQYVKFDSAAFPYAFDKSVYAGVKPKLEKGENYWIDLNYRKLNANIYCSYKPVKSDLFYLLEDTRKIV